MGRLLVLVLLAVIIVWLVRRALRSGHGDAAKSKPPVPGDLVRCAHCGLYFPRAEARTAAERAYCSEEHARLGPGPR
ncbi:MAG TPA: PP0621 family protein [Burkholderiales bacterium]|jgi:uncharacterized protein|nr:PP0621 family protein [Burkholderiales bacterium]